MTGLKVPEIEVTSVTAIKKGCGKNSRSSSNITCRGLSSIGHFDVGHFQIFTEHLFGRRTFPVLSHQVMKWLPRDEIAIDETFCKWTYQRVFDKLLGHR